MLRRCRGHFGGLLFGDNREADLRGPGGTTEEISGDEAVDMEENGRA